MGSSDNQYIRKAKKKRLIKRSMFIIILLAIIIWLFITKSSVFLIKNVSVTGDHLVTKDFISEKVQEIKGENIFFVKSDEVKKILKSDPYVGDISIKRKFPATLEVSVTEKNIAYYIKSNSNYDVISSDLVLLENVDKLKTEGLIEIIGLEKQSGELGQKYCDVSGDSRIENFFNTLYDIKKANSTSHKITKVDVSNLSHIIVYFNDVKVKVGNGTDLTKKINTALNIMEDKKLNFKKGYIDLSFEGAPVLKEEK
ncbi:MAG: FtsQ-type POTRA domain-containing protein [Clostridium sp.]|uniref:cell division protein FtsQ/DivIB n=1 Tax=Clostridium sp. TaxID=1506 RepID=UPI002FCC753E